MDNNKNIVCFATSGEWSATDVVSLAEAVNGIYDVISSYRIISRLRSEQEKAFLRNLERQEHLMHKYMDHPIHYEWYRLWRDMLRDWRKYGRKFPLPYSIPLSPFPFQLPEPQLPNPIEVLQDIELYRGERDALQIDRIHIASPGGFSFTGIGEIIQQLRELLKDLWYRNNQEKTKGELEIIEKYLKLQSEYAESNIPPVSSVTVDRKMIKKVRDDIGKIRSLEKEKKLLNVGEHLDNRPK